MEQHIEIKKLDAIPYIDKGQLEGRFISTMHFYHEGSWELYIDVGDRLMPIKAWPAEAFYFANEREKDTDLYFHFLDFIAQRACFYGTEKPILGLRDDLFNLSASIAKIEHLHATKERIKQGVSRMVATEIEYVYSVCRSMFDLLQEISARLWRTTVLVDEEAEAARRRKKQLPETFSKVLYTGDDQIRTPEEIEERFGIPNLWAEYYVRHATFFTDMRKFRDGVIHNGSQLEYVFDTEHGFLVGKKKRPFSGFDIWSEEEHFDNDTVPLMPALGQVILQTVLACEDFSHMIVNAFEFPPPIVPGMKFFMRGYFDESFSTLLRDAMRRFSEKGDQKQSDAKKAIE
jgi:hypothetical protein